MHIISILNKQMTLNSVLSLTRADKWLISLDKWIWLDYNLKNIRAEAL